MIVYNMKATTVEEFKDEFCNALFDEELTRQERFTKLQYIREKIVDLARSAAKPTTVKQSRLKNLIEGWWRIAANHTKNAKLYWQTGISEVPIRFSDMSTEWIKADLLDKLIHQFEGFWYSIKRTTVEELCSHPVSQYEHIEEGWGDEYTMAVWQNRCGSCGGYLEPKTDLDRY